MTILKNRHYMAPMGERRRIFLNRSRWGGRVLVCFLFTTAVALFFHFRQVYVDPLELNTNAEKYVLAQVGFEFPDVEATSVLKQESMRDVGKIYRIDDKQIFQREKEFENALIQDPTWRKKFPLATFHQMYDGKELVRDALLKARFVDSRTYRKMQELGMSLSGYLVFTPSLVGGRGDFPLDMIHQIGQMAFTPTTRLDETSENLVETFCTYSWSFQEDLTSQNAVRQAVKNGIPLKRTSIEAGSRLINAGDIVTTRHLDMLKAMKKQLEIEHNFSTPLSLLGSFILSAIFTCIGIVYLKIQHPTILASLSKLALLVTIILSTLLLAKTTEHILINTSGNLIDVFRYPIFVLFAALLIAVLLNTEIAVISSCFLAALLCTTLSLNYNCFLAINLVSALSAILFAKRVKKRKEIFEICGKVWLITIPVVIAFNLVENSFWHVHLLTDLFASLVFSTATAVLVVALLPILESAFGIVTDMTLMEYVDPNHPLLRRLSLEAPGTYQHSLVVGAISEAAALVIGANGLFCRVATLYHDIGKLSNPHYFTENQFSGFNIHHLLTPTESAQVILAHVTEGVALAEKYGLPKSFIDIIREHHGTSYVYTFYRAQLDLNEGNEDQIDEAKFRYKGPIPYAKESAIIMIGDSAEAAFRCLDSIDEKVVEEMIDKIVAEKIHNAQLDACQLTFEELGAVKKAIAKTLIITRHARVKYPEKPQVIHARVEQVLITRT